jgi:putative ABC transport system substrate-binding protein
MRRREFIALMGASATWPFTALAQQAGRTYRLGFLYAAPRDVNGVVTAFLDEVGRQGFIEGKNLFVDYRAFESHPERVSEYAAELAKASVDVIATVGPAAARAAQQATKTIPILSVSDDMLREGLVNSMARPDGNTTGLSILATELDGKRQEILIEAVPGIRLMAALADSNMTKTAAKLHALQAVARARGIELSLHQITTSEEIACPPQFDSWGTVADHPSNYVPTSLHSK